MTQRRTFFKHVSSGLAAFAFGGRVPEPAPDEGWLAGLTGRHKQFFDINATNGGAPLGRVSNFIEAYHDAYGLKANELSILAGFHGLGLGLVLGDALWAKYELGKRYGASSPNNPFLARTDAASVTGLQSQGVRFLACRQTIGRLSRELAGEGKGSAQAIAAEIERGLAPGVTPVPAMIVAANRAQESGCTYVYLG